MADASDTVYIATRRQLRGVAESLIAGPQYRASGTIRLAVHPDGFAGAVLPVAVRGTELVWQQGSAPLAGPLVALAQAAGLQPGPPEGVYEIVDAMAAEDVLAVDTDAAARVYRTLYAGRSALETVFPEQHPVLWPEHFDIGVTVADVNYGVSPGDAYHERPYAYVGPWTPRTGEFWNAPFGALHPLDPRHTARELTVAIVDFFNAGQHQLTGA